jgi:hypothetical protein
MERNHAPVITQPTNSGATFMASNLVQQLGGCSQKIRGNEEEFARAEALNSSAQLSMIR